MNPLNFRRLALPFAVTVLAALALTVPMARLPVAHAQNRAQRPKPKPKPTPQPAQDRGIGHDLNAGQDSTRALGLVRTLPGKAKRFALVIGVNQYDDQQVVGLTGATADAHLLADSLVRYAGFPADQVVLLASDLSPENQPTRGNILRKLSNLAAVVPKDGLLLFSFAGHGMERNGQAYLLPTDAQVSDDVNLLEQTAVNVVQIKDWIRKTGVGQVLLLIDACRNDPAAGRAEADNPLTKTYMRGFDFDVRNREVQAFATIYATEIGRRAYELRSQRHGYFTLALAEGLRGQAANDKGEVTLAGLVKYLQDTVPRRVLLDLGQGKVQRPLAVVEGYRADELVLSLKDQHAANVPPIGGEINTAGGESGRAGSQIIPRQPEHAEEEGGALAGTQWTGRAPETGEFTIEFLRGEKLHYSFPAMENGKKVTKLVDGTWRQVEKEVQFSIGEYSDWQCAVEGSVLKCQMNNIDGLTRNFTLLPKRKP